MARDYFDIWFDNNSKNITLTNYKDVIKKFGGGRLWTIKTNGAKKENGDSCLVVSLSFGYMCLEYTNYDLQKKGGDVNGKGRIY